MHVGQVLIILILVLLIIILLGGIAWYLRSSNNTQDSTLQLNDDLQLVRDVMVSDSYLQRLLLVEIINDKVTGSDQITFGKMSNGITTLGRSFVRSFGVAIAQRITTLMQKRNEILRDYYRSMRNVVCQNGTCVHIVSIPPTNVDKVESEMTQGQHKIFDTAFPISSSSIQGVDGIQGIQSLDVTVITHKKLESIDREITDSIAASFQIQDIEHGSNKKRPLVHYQRLYNLISMYDKELINQAKSYASKHYDISMNCAQSSLEISQHISEEFGILMRDTRQRLQTI